MSDLDAAAIERARADTERERLAERLEDFLAQYPEDDGPMVKR